MRKLSIVIPSYNVLPYLKNTLNSLAECTHNSFELIIIDDNSNDETKAFLHEIEDSCTVIFNNKQEYVTHNWNEGIRRSSGEYIAILNNDLKLVKDWDISLINALSEEVWISSPYMTDSVSSTPFANDERFPDIHFAGPIFMLKKKTFDVIGLFPESTRIWGNDKWLSWIVTEVHKKKTVFTDIVVHHYKSKSCDYMSEIMRHRFVEIVNEDMIAFNNIKATYEAQNKKISTPTI